MKLLPPLIALTLIWAALEGSFSPANLLLGAAFSGLVIWFVRRLTASRESSTRKPFVKHSWRWQLERVWGIIVLVVVFMWELLISSVSVAAAVLRPKLRLTPGIVAVPLDVKSDLEITLLANLISLTPGTLSLDVSRDKKTLYIHAMSVGDEEAEKVRRDIKRTLEHHVIRAVGHSEQPH